MIRKPVGIPFELLLDRIAQRYGVLPWEVEKGDLEWLEIIIAIMTAENGAENRQKALAKTAQKVRGIGQGQRFR